MQNFNTQVNHNRRIVLLYLLKGPSFILETTGNLKNVLPSVRTDLYYKSESLKKFDLMRL